MLMFYSILWPRCVHCQQLLSGSLLSPTFQNVFGVCVTTVMCLHVKQLDDERESAKDAAFAQKLEDQFDDLDEQFLREYRLKRLEELRNAYETT